jgi:hypothetical protein
MNAPTNFSLAVLTEVLLMIEFCWNANSVSSGTLKMDAPSFFEIWVTVYRLQDRHLDERCRDDTKSEMVDSQSPQKKFFQGFHAPCYSSDDLVGSYTM